MNIHFFLNIIFFATNNAYFKHYSIHCFFENNAYLEDSIIIILMNIHCFYNAYFQSCNNAYFLNVQFSEHCLFEGPVHIAVSEVLFFICFSYFLHTNSCYTLGCHTCKMQSNPYKYIYTYVYKPRMCVSYFFHMFLYASGRLLATLSYIHTYIYIYTHLLIIETQTQI